MSSTNEKRNNRKNISNEDRKRIIDKAIQGNSSMSIANDLTLNYKSVNRIVNNYLKNGVYEIQVRGGDRRSKLNANQKQEIISWVNENALLTLKDLSDKCESNLQIKVSISTIDRVLKTFHYTLKNIIAVPERRNCDLTIAKRALYAQEFRHLESQIEDKNLIFLDEVGFSLVTRPKRGRALKGVSPYVTVAAARSRNISVIAAMNKYGMIYHKINNHPVTGEDFKNWIIELKRLCIEIGITNPHFILDNARIHHYNGLNNILSDLNIQLVFLAPYSPFLNPIENIFSIWKNLVIRKEAQNERELIEYINSCFEEITQEHCDGCYRKMLSYVQKSERNEIIME